MFLFAIRENRPHVQCVSGRVAHSDGSLLNFSIFINQLQFLNFLPILKMYKSKIKQLIRAAL